MWFLAGNVNSTYLLIFKCTILTLRRCNLGVNVLLFFILFIFGYIAV